MVLIPTHLSLTIGSCHCTKYNPNICKCIRKKKKSLDYDTIMEARDLSLPGLCLLSTLLIDCLLPFPPLSLQVGMTDKSSTL